MKDEGRPGKRRVPSVVVPRPSVLPSRILFAVVVAEALGAGILIARQLMRPTPPLPDLSRVDPITADEIRSRAEDCHTAGQWRAIGETYLALGFGPESEACYRIAADLADDDPDIAFEHGFALERIGRIAEANDAYRRAISQDLKRSEEWRFFVGRNHLRLGETAEAEAAFQKSPRADASWFELARLALADGRPNEADLMFSQLSADHPYAIQPYLLLGQTQAAEDATSRLPTPLDREAARFTELTRKFGPEGQRAEAERLLAAREISQAGALLDRTLSARWDPETADLLAEAHFLQGRPEKAVEILLDVIERAGPSIHLLTRLGDTYKEMDRLDDARAAWLRAIALGYDPTVKDLYFRLSLVAREAGDEAEYQRYAGRGFLAAGAEELRAGRIARAREALDEAVKLVPAEASAWFWRGEAYRRLKQADEARQSYAECLRLNPNDGRAHRGLDSP